MTSLTYCQDMPSDNDLRQTAADILGRPLADYVAEKRAATPRWSWRLIADYLDTDTNGQVIVSYETLRTWYGVTDEIAVRP